MKKFYSSVFRPDYGVEFLVLQRVGMQMEPITISSDDGILCVNKDMDPDEIHLKVLKTLVEKLPLC